MRDAVHILATVRKAELLDAALLVFRTLRTGFPEQPVHVWGNALNSRMAEIVGNAAASCGALFTNLSWTVHDEWIEGLIQECTEPFWICDTDVVFWKAMPQPAGEVAFSGRFERQFLEEWTNTVHVERLHTAVMWFNPGALRAAMRVWMAKIPPPWGHLADMPLVKQHFVPARPQTLFYDSCAGLWQAGIGAPFDVEQNAAFEHLHCATYADVVGVKGLKEAHQLIYREPERARGIRKLQDEYYERRAQALRASKKGKAHAI